MSDRALQERIAGLRGTGAWRLDPVQFRALEALARRADGQPEAVRALLLRKLAMAVADYEQRAAANPAPQAPRAAAPGRRPAPVAATPLAALAAGLREAAAARLAAASPGEPAHEDELASARRFRQAWNATRTVQQVQQALQRRPANAGPLNSHALVLHSLGLMRELSPEYLRRFLTQVESLQWLQDARETPPPRAARAGRSRRKSV